MRERMRRVAIGAAALALASTVLVVFLSLAEINSQPGSRFEEVMAGTAQRPFQYRILVPQLVRLLEAMTPNAMRQLIQASAGPFQASLDHAFITDPVVGLYLVLILFAALVAYRLAFRYLASTFYPERAELASFVALLAIIALFRYGYFYDFTSLLFGTLLFAFMFRAHWIAYMATFVLACLNKETSIVFVGIFAVCLWKAMDRKMYLGLIAAQTMIWAAVRLATMTAYAENPGGDAFWYFDFNLKAYTRLGPSAAIAATALAALFVLVLWRFTQKPRPLRLSLVGLPPMFVLFLSFGYPYEFRVFYEVLPPVLLLAMHSLLRTPDNGIQIAITKQGLDETAQL